MIVLIARAVPEGKPPATTPETIQAHSEELSEALSALLEGMIPIVTHITGVVPKKIGLAVEWVDGTETTADVSTPFPGGKVPPHMS